MFRVGANGSPLLAPTYLGLSDLPVPWHGDRQHCTHRCQKGKIVHTYLGISLSEWALRFADVVCDSWGPMCISYIPYMVHWSMRPACTGVMKIVRVRPKI